MIDTSELRAAAERLGNEAYNIVEHAKMCEQPLRRALDAIMLARAYLAEHPTDDGEPVTVNDIPRNDVISLDEYGTLTICNGKIDNATRGDVRRLCAALGVKLKEGGE